MPSLFWGFLRSTAQVIRRAPFALGAARNRAPQKRDDRRDRARLPTNEQGSVVWLNSGGDRHEMKINIRDVSDSGLGISLVELLRVGQTVWISTEANTRCKGVVRYCVRKPAGISLASDGCFGKDVVPKGSQRAEQERSIGKPLVAGNERPRRLSAMPPVTACRYTSATRCRYPPLCGWKGTSRIASGPLATARLIKMATWWDCT